MLTVTVMTLKNQNMNYLEELTFSHHSYLLVPGNTSKRAQFL